MLDNLFDSSAYKKKLFVGNQYGNKDSHLDWDKTMEFLTKLTEIVVMSYIRTVAMELMAQRLDSANCPIQYLCFWPIKLHSLIY